MYTMVVVLLLVGATTLVVGVPQSLAQEDQLLAFFQCPSEEYGVYEDPYQCDKFWECEYGVATPLLCEDGLVFDSHKARAGHVDPCESPYVVNCEDKSELQPMSNPSPVCPRLHGVFADPDESVCTRYYTCVGGLGTAVDCEANLYFNKHLGKCDWDYNANRTGCVERHHNACINNGKYCCTGEDVFDANGVRNPHPAFPDLEDCQKFFVCLNAKIPQEASCSLGQVYNEKSFMCDYPENVPECEGWYKHDPRFAEYYSDYPASANAPGAADVGTQDTVG